MCVYRPLHSKSSDRYGNITRGRKPEYQVTNWLNYAYTYAINATSQLNFSLAQLPPATYAAYATIWDEYMIDKVTIRVAVMDKAGENQVPVVPIQYDVIMAPNYAISSAQSFEVLLANNNKQHQKYLCASSGQPTMDYTIYPRVQVAALNNASNAQSTVTQRAWLGFAGSQANEVTHAGLLLRVGQVDGAQGAVDIKAKFHLKFRSY